MKWRVAIVGVVLVAAIVAAAIALGIFEDEKRPPADARPLTKAEGPPPTEGPALRAAFIRGATDDDLWPALRKAAADDSVDHASKSIATAWDFVSGLTVSAVGGPAIASIESAAAACAPAAHAQAFVAWDANGGAAYGLAGPKEVFYVTRRKGKQVSVRRGLCGRPLDKGRVLAPDLATFAAR